MVKSLFLYAPKIIFDLFFDLLYFLPWWYTRGLLGIGGRAAAFIRNKEEDLAVIVWVRCLFKPLYDDHGWQAMVKSVILRVGQLVLRSIILMLWTVAVVVGMLVYVALPLVVLWEIIYQLI